MRPIFFGMVVVFSSFAFCDDNDPSIGVGAIASSEKSLIANFLKNKAPKPKAGVVVTTIVPYSPGEEAGVNLLDTIYKIDGTTITTGESFIKKVQSLEVGKESKFFIYRLSEKNTWISKTLKITPISKEKLDKLKLEAPPLKISGVVIRKNTIGVPEVKIQITNDTDSDAVAVRLNIECWNRFGEKVKNFSGNSIFNAIGQDTIPSHGEDVSTWMLATQENTTKVCVYITHIKFKNGTEWKRDENTKGFDFTAEM
jgi:hypothetical protein